MKISSFTLTLCLALFTCFSLFAQFDIPDIPKNQTSLYDYINLLQPSQKSNLERKLIKYSDTTSTQIVVAIISSTNGENINYLGANWLTKWGIGQKGKDNGVLIILAREDRKIAINTGYGVEHLLTDAMSKRIIERDIIPYFKQNNYYGGLNRGTDAIFEVMTGEYKGKPASSSSPFPFHIVIFMFFIFLVIVISLSKNRRGGGRGGNRGNRTNGTSILDAIILSNMGRSSSSGWGSSGGGWSSGGGFGGGFGGGMGGGGGASGGW